MEASQASKVIDHFRSVVFLRDGAGRTDGQLLKDYVSRREEAALAALVHRHGPMVWGVCRRVLRNYHDAEDAFQATFLVLVRKAASLAAPELLANWLYGVAHQTALKARATAARKWARERQVTELPEPAVTEQSLWSDLQPLLDQELSRLPEKYRVAIVLCDLEGKTRKEAARQLGVPEGTLAARVTRGRTMLAKRLARRGLAVSGGSLAAVLGQNTVSASMPAAVVSSTINAASRFATGTALAGTVISARVVALTKGVIKAMLIRKLKTAATVMLVIALAGLGAGALTVRALAQKPGAAEVPARRSGPTNTEGLTTVAAFVAKVSPDGKTITLEMPSEGRGEEPRRTDIHLTDKTEVVYHGVGLNMARPTEGYHAHVWLNKGSTDTATKLNFTVVDRTRQTRSFFSGKVVAVSKDLKGITLEFPPVRDQESKKIDFKLSDKTAVTYDYTYIAQGVPKPIVGYWAELWLEEGSTDTVAKAHFVDPNREQDALRVGKLVGVAKDGKSITLEMPARARREEPGAPGRPMSPLVPDEGPTKIVLKLTPTSEITFQGVGSDEAKLTEGYGARVWLTEGSLATVAKAVFLGTRTPNERGR